MKIRFRFLLGLALVTTGAAIFAIAFRSSLTWLYRALYGAENVVDSIAKLPPWLRLVVPMFGALVAGTVARLRGARTQGVSNVMEAIALGNVRLSLRTTASRAASSWAAIAAGVSIGREGPLIEVGGALGAGLARLMKAPLNDTRVLVAAGTAAGFAAAYNTPLAAALFVLESIAGVAAPELLLPVMAATVGATAITRATVGAGPIYGQRAFGLQSNLDLISFAVFGVVAAAAAVLFKQVLALCERWFDEHRCRSPLGLSSAASSSASLPYGCLRSPAMGMNRSTGSSMRRLVSAP